LNSPLKQLKLNGKVKKQNDFWTIKMLQPRSRTTQCKNNKGQTSQGSKSQLRDTTRSLMQL